MLSVQHTVKIMERPVERNGEDKETAKGTPYIPLESIRVVSFFESSFEFTKLSRGELVLLSITLAWELRNRFP